MRKIQLIILALVAVQVTAASAVIHGLLPCDSNSGAATAVRQLANAASADLLSAMGATDGELPEAGLHKVGMYTEDQDLALQTHPWGTAGKFTVPFCPANSKISQGADGQAECVDANGQKSRPRENLCTGWMVGQCTMVTSAKCLVNPDEDREIVNGTDAQKKKDLQDRNRFSLRGARFTANGDGTVAGISEVLIDREFTAKEGGDAAKGLAVVILNKGPKVGTPGILPNWSQDQKITEALMEAYKAGSIKFSSVGFRRDKVDAQRNPKFVGSVDDAKIAEFKDGVVSTQGNAYFGSLGGGMIAGDGKNNTLLGVIYDFSWKRTDKGFQNVDGPCSADQKKAGNCNPGPTKVTPIDAIRGALAQRISDGVTLANHVASKVAKNEALTDAEKALLTRFGGIDKMKTQLDAWNRQLEAVRKDPKLWMQMLKGLDAQRAKNNCGATQGA